MAGDETGKKGGEGASNKEKGDNAETIASMPWQRKGGRLSRPPSAQRVYSVSGRLQANARAVSDDDETPKLNNSRTAVERVQDLPHTHQNERTYSPLHDQGVRSKVIA